MRRLAKLVLMSVRGQIERPRLRRDRVVAAEIPGVAAQQPHEPEPGAPEHSEARDRLERVLRAARVEAAARTEEWTHGPLIEPDQAEGELTHASATFFHSTLRLARSTAGSAA